MKFRLLLLTMFTMVYIMAGAAPAYAGGASDSNGFVYKPDKKVSIILDTDIDTDVDDIGALAVLYSYVQEGRAEVLATVGSCNSGYAARCLKGINAYFGYPDVPVGMSPDCPSSGESPYQRVIAEIYGGDSEAEKAEPAVDVYRKALTYAEDGSVVVVVVGAQNNFCSLLRSQGDEISPLSGLELVRQKVKLCVMMGGGFPKSGSNGEYNIRLDPDSAHYVSDNCPVPIVWSGFEIGAEIYTGNRRNELDEASPVRLSYSLYGKDAIGDYVRQSWDLTAVLYAVEGAGEYWDIQTGRMEINTRRRIIDAGKGAAYNTWTADPDGKDAILIEKMDPEQIAAILNERMVKAQKGENVMNAEVSSGEAISALYHIAETAGLAVRYGSGPFGMSDKITREQLAAILYHYAAGNGISAYTTSETAVVYDMADVSDYARESVEWAVKSGIMTEAGDHHFGPSGHVTQEQMAAVMTRLCTLIFSTGTK